MFTEKTWIDIIDNISLLLFFRWFPPLYEHICCNLSPYFNYIRLQCCRTQWNQSIRGRLCKWATPTRQHEAEDSGIGTFGCEAVWYLKNFASFQWLRLQNIGQVKWMKPWLNGLWLFASLSVSFLTFSIFN